MIVLYRINIIGKHNIVNDDDAVREQDCSRYSVLMTSQHSGQLIGRDGGLGHDDAVIGLYFLRGFCFGHGDWSNEKSIIDTAKLKIFVRTFRESLLVNSVR